jgi:hypothetical protein
MHSYAADGTRGTFAAARVTHLTLRAAQMRSQRSMIWWPAMKSEPPSKPWRATRWPKPLMCTTPCSRWSLEVAVPFDGFSGPWLMP